MKLIIRTISFLFLLILPFAAAPTAHAQDSSVSVDFGLGTAMDSANTSPASSCIDTFGDGGCFSTPKMTGLFGTFGADFMIKPHFGIGGEYAFRMAQGSFAGLNYRPAFFDFNAIYVPTSEKSRVVPEFQAGLGGANLKFYYSQQFCDIFAGCSTTNTFLESSNHFELHFSGGVRFYVKGGLFIRPQVDVHWVNNFTQFGSDWAPVYTVAIGYTLGAH